MKKAFTMLELVFVIVIIGILSSMALSSPMGNTTNDETITKIISHIRYTQHLAMIDDHIHNGDEWYKTRWQIKFVENSCGHHYTIFNDLDKDGDYTGDSNEVAVDIDNPSKLMTGDCLEDDNVKSMKLNIKTITFKGGCDGDDAIVFDILGHPYRSDIKDSNGPIDKMLKTQCIIDIEMDDETFVLTIEPISGYIKLKK